MSKRLSIMLLLMSGLTLSAQNIRLTPYRAASALYLNLDHLYSYNQYEHSRIEAGFTWVTPNETAEKPRVFIGQWSLGAYAAFGFKNKEFKYGGSVQLRLPSPGDVKIRLRGFNDLQMAASRRMNDYNFLLPQLNATFLASRFVSVRGAQLETSVSLRRNWTFSAAALLAWEQYRFNNAGSLYLRSTFAPFPTFLPHTNLTARLDHGRDFAIEATAGITKGGSTPSGNIPYLRMLAQYDGDPGDFGLHLFAQTGFVTPDAPYSRMFDLSGTGRTFYFFRNTFLTVRPNAFTSNFFAHLCLNYTSPLPLWQSSWSQPQPFLQVNAMWGRLFGQDYQGKLFHDGLELQSPYMGLFEPATGFDGLLRWGLFDLGFAVAYQLCPFKAPYLNDTPTDNFAFAIVATLIFDKTPPRISPTSEQPYTIVPIK